MSGPWLDLSITHWGASLEKRLPWWSTFWWSIGGSMGGCLSPIPISAVPHLRYSHAGNSEELDTPNIRYPSATRSISLNVSLRRPTSSPPGGQKGRESAVGSHKTQVHYL